MTEKHRISVNFENGRNSTNFPFMAASTPISVAKNGHADVCSQKQRRPKGKPEHSRRRKTTPIAGKSQQEREIVSGCNNAQGPRRREKRRNERESRSFREADVVTQNSQEKQRSRITAQFPLAAPTVGPRRRFPSGANRRTTVQFPPAAPTL